MKYGQKYLAYFKPDERNGFKSVVNDVVTEIVSLYYEILYLFIKQKEQKTSYKYNLSFCAIFKNEAKYLREWIEYHKLVGVDHMFLYNNFSTDDFMDVLEPYIESDYVELIDWPVEQGQMRAYVDCVERFSSLTKWLAFIDIDEFVIPNHHNTINEFLLNFSNRPVVIVYWKYFGTSGTVNRDINGLVLEDFTCSWKDYVNVGKCFYNTSFVFDPINREDAFNHRMWSRYKCFRVPPVNIFGRVCIKNRHKVKKDFPIQINHYYTKSYNEYIEKTRKGDAFFKISPKDLKSFNQVELRCCSTDYHAYKYLIGLKKALAIIEE